MKPFQQAYSNLNPEQKRAVETINGPVMVIAGPGTGKTQVLALRIAHILKETDTPPDGIICLTFTNAGVRAMRERLISLIGPTATKIKISTFHGYGIELVEEYYALLGYDRAPTLLDDGATVALFDSVLRAHEWEYLRPRSNTALYYADLKSLISTLKRDDIEPEAFVQIVQDDIERITNDPESISSRGPSKGSLKKEVEKKIESLSRTREAAQFYAEYEMQMVERNQIDFNDVLRLMVRIVETSEDVAASIRERFLYVHIDEHQDSTRVQNAFLQAVWGDEEQPNIFVVGDDRQLIYGFGGASLAYFESFKHTFGTATCITLTRNYRSSQTILDSAEVLLQSVLAEGKLIGSDAHTTALELLECEYPRDEIIAAGHMIQAKIAEGVAPEECAILVPKNRQVKNAVTILRDLGVPVAAGKSRMLFEQDDTQAFLNILRVIAQPHNATTLCQTILSPLSGIAPLTAHQYLYNADTRNLSVGVLCESDQDAIALWGNKIAKWITLAQSVDAYEVLQVVGSEVLLDTAPDDDTLRRRVEIIRTLLHIVMARIEQGYRVHLDTCVEFIDRLIAYGEDIALAILDANKGVQVVTLHGSKGLEFECVWIAHMDEHSLMRSKRSGFTLPRDIAQQQEEEREDVARRQLYVAITRAKKYCTISYANKSNAGVDQKLASIIESLPESAYSRHFHQYDVENLSQLRKIVEHSELNQSQQPTAVVELVREIYTDKKVSVTLLNNFFECPWKWYFRNILQLPEPTTESLQIGNITHKTIEYMLTKKGTHISPQEIENAIETFAKSEAHYDQELAKRLIYQAQNGITTWMEFYYPKLLTQYESEKNISYHDVLFPHLTIMGKIDLIEEISPSEVRVSDWKTGTPKSQSDINKEDENGRMASLLRQLCMYTYLIEGQSHDTIRVSESRLVFLEAKDTDTNAVITKNIDRENVERLRQEILDYDQLVQSGDWITQKCLARHNRDGDVCQYCTLARHIYNS